MPTVWLIGFRGTGKTSVGKKLAAFTGLHFVDTDQEIQHRERMDIATIFARRGEPHFRIAEQQVILELATRHDLVAAVGGGACGHEASVLAMRGSGTVVWLTAEPEAIERRLAADQATPAQRPPLTALASPREEIEHLLERRCEDYARAAHLTVDTTGLSVDEVAHEILRLLRRRTH